MDSDLSTFRSSLIREVQPDFTITVGSYQWKVHAKKLQKSSFFQKLIDNKPVPGNQNVVLQDEEPLLVGYLVLWLYTGEYSECTTLDIQDIMKNGKIMTPGSPLLGTPTASSPPCSQDDDEWDPPVALHAKMFLLADRFGIGDLVRKATDDFRAELIWNADSVFIPSLQELFGGSGYGAVKTSSTPILHPKSSSMPSTPPLSSTDGDSDRDDKGNSVYSSAPLPGSEMFDLLASTASIPTFLSKNLAQPGFEKVMVENPAFQFEVLRRVSLELDNCKHEIESNTPKPPAVKTTRRKKAPSKSVERQEPKAKKAKIEAAVDQERVDND
ncbi:hypothetical protein PV10_02298 [Exophiala mesophila]|uniref:BTB domain-containing protein n=1 Tax=Exophiala mesophila TaxID=212818 RepID=A0A0D1ZJ03_EXOME|nr:uncharacterized protein PV10_02298 [Exophiala mesophila]KIV94542.1 hypothetical protein PV10_02298 [Exophiala mesophila]